MSENPSATVPESTLSVRTFTDVESMGQAAARDVATSLRNVLQKRASARMIFASAPSQLTMLTALAHMDLPWHRVEAFHMDEYLGLAPDAPQGFGNWISTHFFEPAGMGRIHLLSTRADAAHLQAYEKALSAAPIDIVCLGIGVNGHIAFNDPPVADFHDPVDIKRVTLDPICRQQQVDEGCFDSLDAVPRQAVTLTIPRLLRAGELFCVVPGAHKRQAVEDTLYGPLTTDCPASVLHTHPHCTLYLDQDATPARHHESHTHA